MKYAVAVAALVLLAACSSTPPRPDQVKMVPPDRVLGLQAASDGSATLVVTRDNGFVQGGCYMGVFVDGTMVAKLGNGERAQFYVSPGDHVLGTWNTGSGLCSFGDGENRREVNAAFRSGETRRFRVSVNNMSGVEITPTTFE